MANNVAVIIASGLVWYSNTGWADTLVGLVLSIFLLKSSYRVITTAIKEV
jgi:Co/Zn/Cd efflux system component